MGGLIRRGKAQVNENDYADEELCTLREAAGILRLDESTIRKRRGGTQHLTHVRQGKEGSLRPRLMLVRAEVMAHRSRLIRTAKKKSNNGLELVWGTGS